MALGEMNRQQTSNGQRGAIRRGFTIIELMVTVLILAILAMLAMPSAQNAVMEQRIRSAVLEVMHLVDFARVQAQSRNRSYEMVVDKATRKITVNESINTRCDPDSFKDGTSNVRVLDFLSGQPTGDLQHVSISGLSPNGLGASFNLCFKPDGRVLQTNTGKPLKGDDGYGAGEARITLQRRTRSGTTTGIKHVIVVPYNGIPQLETGTPAS